MKKIVTSFCLALLFFSNACVGGKTSNGVTSDDIVGIWEYKHIVDTEIFNTWWIFTRNRPSFVIFLDQDKSPMSHDKVGRVEWSLINDTIVFSQTWPMIPSHCKIISCKDDTLKMSGEGLPNIVMTRVKF